MCIGDYVLQDVIGHGSFAIVVLGQHKVTHQKVAVKVFSKNAMRMSPRHKETFDTEVEILKRADHPYIVSMYEVLEDDLNHYIVMEYLERGTILEYINKHGPLSEFQVSTILGQIASALEYMRKVLKVAHRDIKLDNILFDQSLNVRFVDFGLSKDCCSEDQLFTTMCGSLYYAAPEILTGNKYTVSSEMWSLGVVVFALLTGKLPFFDKNAQSFTERVLKSQVKFPEKVSGAWMDLISQMLQKNPEDRMTLEELRHHQLVRSAVAPSRSQVLDIELLTFMREKGYSCENVGRDIANKTPTRESTVYKMLQRQKMMRTTIHRLNCIPKAQSPLVTPARYWSKAAAAGCQNPTLKCVQAGAHLRRRVILRL